MPTPRQCRDAIQLWTTQSIFGQLRSRHPYVSKHFQIINRPLEFAFQRAPVRRSGDRWRCGGPACLLSIGGMAPGTASRVRRAYAGSSAE